MKFQVIINAHPNTETAQQALNFCLSVINSGHQLVQLFFYGPGVLNLFVDKNERAYPIKKTWAECCKHAIESVCCVNSVDTFARKCDTQENIHIAGMAQMIASASDADKTITFGQQLPNE